MKLQKRLSRNYKDKKYHKYIIILPEKEVIKSGFKEGDELEIESKKGKIELKKNEQEIFKTRG
jgi:bifunctional DNA-binding transcriptional regulator/antitoxin component of YhaV-PrlF toxin-antitoxin module